MDREQEQKLRDELVSLQQRHRSLDEEIAELELSGAADQLTIKRLKKEKLQVSLDMAGAVCEDLNEPLQSISTHSEILLMYLSGDDPQYGKVKQIVQLTKRMAAITKKLMGITKYETKDYVKGVKIIDLDKSAQDKD